MNAAKPFYLPLKIFTYPNVWLVAHNRRLESYTEEVAAKVRQMFALMYKAEGVGLAAPQVGWNVKLFILNLTADPKEVEHERVFFNPEIENYGDITVKPESCLSFPGVEAEIERYSHTFLAANTPTGKVSLRLAGFAAQAVQHEMDHLDGILIHERMTRKDRERNEPLLRALAEKSRTGR